MNRSNINEIGSEFWQKKTTKKEKTKNNLAHLLSGRTALDFIIKDIKAERQLGSVMLPSYCCESMIEPFERNGVDVRFYKVSEESIDYPTNNCDAVLIFDFFGYEEPFNAKIALAESDNGKITIYDSTHKLNGPSIKVDYAFCSYRKWQYCNFSEVRKLTGDFCISKPVNLNTAYCEMRDKAARLKAAYMAGDKADKLEFLKLFSSAEDMLNHDYVGYTGEIADVDIKAVIEARRRNAHHLISGLQNIPGIKLWKATLGPTDTPLFVPILVRNGLRDALKIYLIKNFIYCPVHWPLSRSHGAYRDIYDEELSLICDQRYSIEDMDREVEVIKNFFNWDKANAINILYN